MMGIRPWNGRKSPGVTVACAAFTVVTFCSVLGCRSPGPGGRVDVHQWGTMRDALGQRQSQARVRLSQAVATPHAYGVGALAGLAGEVTVLDGTVWLARVEADAVRTESTRSPSDSATLLTLFYVPDWRAITLDEPVEAGRLPGVIRSFARLAGLDKGAPFPFIVRGPLSVKGHVINGSCPMSVLPGGSKQDAIGFASNNRVGTAVGVYAENGTGVITHHDCVIHVHVIFEGPAPLSGHLDSIAVGAGAELLLPSASG